MNKLYFKYLFISIVVFLIINSVLTLKIKAQTSISISSGIIEQKVGIPNLTSDDLQTIPLNLTIKYFFEKPNIELGLSYYLFRTLIEKHGAYKSPYEYSYWYRAYNPINLIAFCGIRSDRNQFIQTYGGIISGYWSYKMWFYSENWNNFNETVSIEDRIHQFAIGPKFGLSLGRKFQLILEAEYFLFTKTKYSGQNLLTGSSLSLGVKYNF